MPPLRCGMCSLTFPDRASRQTHYESVPGHPRCAECNRIFGSIIAYSSHTLATGHIGGSVCEPCSRVFVNESALRMHLMHAGVHRRDRERVEQIIAEEREEEELELIQLEHEREMARQMADTRSWIESDSDDGSVWEDEDSEDEAGENVSIDHLRADPETEELLRRALAAEGNFQRLLGLHSTAAAQDDRSSSRVSWITFDPGATPARTDAIVEESDVSANSGDEVRPRSWYGNGGRPRSWYSDEILHDHRRRLVRDNGRRSLESDDAPHYQRSDSGSESPIDPNALMYSDSDEDTDSLVDSILLYDRGALGRNGDPLASTRTRTRVPVDVDGRPDAPRWHEWQYRPPTPPTNTGARTRTEQVPGAWPSSQSLSSNAGPAAITANAASDASAFDTNGNGSAGTSRRLPAFLSRYLPFSSSSSSGPSGSSAPADPHAAAVGPDSEEKPPAVGAHLLGPESRWNADDAKQGAGGYMCPICLCAKEELSSVKCGHVFCTSCIIQSLRVKRECPVCREYAKFSHLRRIYLSF